MLSINMRRLSQTLSTNLWRIRNKKKNRNVSNSAVAK